MDPQIALYVAITAAVVGPTLGALLTAAGGWINDYSARKREERQQEREDQRLQEQREREERERLLEGRLRAYSDFVAMTILAGPGRPIPERQEALNKSYVETLIYASRRVEDSASLLYGATSKALDLTTHKTHEDIKALWPKIDKARNEFLADVRIEREQGE